MWPIIIMLVIGVGALITWGVVEDGNLSTNSLVTSAVGSTQGLFKSHEDCNEVGDCVAFFASKEPHQDMDAGYDIEDVEDTLYYKNGSEIPKESYITGVTSDTSFTKTFTKESRNRVGNDGQMLVQQGNIATIQSQIKIIDPMSETGELIEPRIYKYWLTITCQEIQVDSCNNPNISSHGTTGVGGTFTYKWTTNFNILPAIYDVKIVAESETINPLTQRPYSVEGILKIEVFK